MTAERMVCGHRFPAGLLDTSTTFFQRIGCVRCDYAIDGAALKRVAEANPSLERYIP